MFGLSANNKFCTFTADMFRYMCILSGCDYLSSIKATGIKKAFADVKRNKDISPSVCPEIPNVFLDTQKTRSSS